MADRSRRSSERAEPADEAPAQARPRGPRRGKRRRGRRGSFLGRLFYWGAVAALCCIVLGIGTLFWTAYHLPPIESLEVPKRPPAVQILGLDGRVLANRGEMGGAAIALKELPPYLPKAFLAIEDRRFYSHYGVEPAAQRYFGKSAKNVTLAEAALLAGLVKSPSRLSPTKNFDGAEKRAQLVLAAMSDYGFADPGAVKVALAHPPRIVQPSAGGSVNYVADWVMDVVNELIGRFDQDIVVDTTIDPVLQAAAEKSLVDVLGQKSEKFDVEQGALVAMTPAGAVRALVGGRNYAESQYNRAVAARRQPGSAFKPFVYL